MLRDTRANLQSASLTSSFHEEVDCTSQLGPARSSVNVIAGSSLSNLQQLAVSSMSEPSSGPVQGSPLTGSSVSQPVTVAATSIRSSGRQSGVQLAVPAASAALTSQNNATLLTNSGNYNNVGSPNMNQEELVGASGNSSGAIRRKELLRAQKRAYRDEKKRAMRELTDVLQDPSLVVLADWMKVRGALKSWTKFWCVLKPGVLVLYKKAGSAPSSSGGGVQSSSVASGTSAGAATGVATAVQNNPVSVANNSTLHNSTPALNTNTGGGASGSGNVGLNSALNPTTSSDDRGRDQNWVGTVLLNCCEVIERPSKKDGFCFKLFHPLDQSIWATRGPRGEAFGAFTQPLPYSHLIFRAPSEAAGRCWLDALELAVRCSNLLVRAMSSRESGRESLTAAPAGGKLPKDGSTPAMRSVYSAADESPVASSALSNAIFRSSLRNVSALLDDADAELDAEETAVATIRRRQLLNESELERHFHDTFDSGANSSSTADGSAEKRFGATGAPLNSTYAEADADGELDDGEVEMLDGDEELDEQAAGALSMHAPPADALETDEETDSVGSSTARQHTSNDANKASADAVITSNKPSESSSTSSRHSDLKSGETPSRSSTTNSSLMSKTKAMAAPSARTSQRERTDAAAAAASPCEQREIENSSAAESSETKYLENTEEDLGRPGDVLTEEVNDENKSIIWSMLKQLRPGMDLSRVVLPTFILEPRSLLDKFTDYYSHADILSEACQQADAYSRMRSVVKWYLSGFYKKPRGLKKPYNPIMGESFRCCWQHPRTGARTFYIAEQVSHHPPVSAFYVSNRRDGFCVQGTVLARSKFYGNSLSAILEASCRLTILNRGEEYTLTMPYVHCKGILIGTLSMEYGGKVVIRCERTGYATELEFKHKPLLSTSDSANRVAGRIRLGGDTLATIAGRWDRDIHITDSASGRTELLFNSTPEVRASRLKRCTVPVDSQYEYESERLWLRCSEALRSSNMEEATRYKLALEDRQRDTIRELKARGARHQPRYFDLADTAATVTASSGAPSAIQLYTYKYADLRAWDAAIDLHEFEDAFVIQTKTRHAVSCVRPSRSATIRSASDSSGTLTVQSPIDLTPSPVLPQPEQPLVAAESQPSADIATKVRSPVKGLVQTAQSKRNAKTQKKVDATAVSRTCHKDENDGLPKQHRTPDDDSESLSSGNGRAAELSDGSSSEDMAATNAQLDSIRQTMSSFVTRLDTVESILHRVLERLDVVAADSEQKAAGRSGRVALLDARWARGGLPSAFVFGVSVLAVLLVAILFARLLV